MRPLALPELVKLKDEEWRWSNRIPISRQQVAAAVSVHCPTNRSENELV